MYESFIYRINQQPEYVRIRWVWGVTGILGFVMVVIWAFSTTTNIKRAMTAKETGVVAGAYTQIFSEAEKVRDGFIDVQRHFSDAQNSPYLSRSSVVDGGTVATSPSKGVQQGSMLGEGVADFYQRQQDPLEIQEEKAGSFPVY